jgi:hypothetical protein
MNKQFSWWLLHDSRWGQKYVGGMLSLMPLVPNQCLKQLGVQYG